MGTNTVGEDEKDISAEEVGTGQPEGAGLAEGQVGRSDPLGVPSSGATLDLGPTGEELPLSDSKLQGAVAEIEGTGLQEESAQEDLGVDEVSGVEAVNPLDPPDAFDEVQRRFDEARKKVDVAFQRYRERFGKDREMPEEYAAIKQEYVAAEKEYAAIKQKYDAAIRQRREPQRAVTGAAGVGAVNPLALDAGEDGLIDGDDEVSGGMDSDGVEFSAEDLSEEEIQPGELGEGTAGLIAEAGQSEEKAGTPPPDAFAEAQERFDKAGQKRTKAWKKKHDVRLNKLGYNAACNEYDAACEEYNEARRAYDAAIQKRNEEEELQQAVTGAAGVGKGQAEKGGVGWERIVVSKREKVDGQNEGTGDQGHPVQKRRIPIKEGRPNLTQEPLNTVFSGGGGVMSRLGRNKFWLKILVFLGIGGAAAGVAYEVMQRRLAHQEVVDTLDAKEEANRAGFDADMQMLQDSIAAQKKELGVK